MDVGEHIFSFFRQNGYSPAAAAGIIGNTTQESSNNPNAPGGGLIQGQGGRTSSGSLDAQLHGILGELQGSERHTAEALQHVKGPREAARIFSDRFERPGIPMLANRERYAEQALQRYGGKDLVHVNGAQQLSGALAPTLGAAAPEQSPAQSADLVNLLRQQLSPQQPTASVAGTPLQRPATSGGPEQAAGPKVPAAITPKAPAENGIMAAIQKLNEDAGEQQPAAQQQQGAAAPEGEAGAPSPQTAVQVGEHDLGKFAESSGPNLGPELNKLEQKFGFTGEPWCAIFATTAAAQGGASKATRTASVAQINQWAGEGSHGYQRGLKPSSQAKPGDLLTFGNDHVALVKEVRGGKIITIEGNANGSGGVVQLSHAIGEGQVARPKYGGR